MTTQALLHSLLNYKATADAELLDALADLPLTPPLQTALRVLNHLHTVDRIFVANLQEIGHAYVASWSDEAPLLAQLAADIRETDRWYLNYISAVNDATLDETIGFSFTDGGRGRMTRAEMLAHVITHSGYHRGEISTLLPQLGTVSSRDVFTGYLHRAEPARRA
jgi:uncharacterized damage-inducible protein DinB